MVKVNFNNEGQLVNYFGIVAKLAKANFVFVNNVYQYGRVSVPTVHNDDLYLPRTNNYIKSIEQVKPTDI